MNNEPFVEVHQEHQEPASKQAVARFPTVISRVDWQPYIEDEDHNYYDPKNSKWPIRAEALLKALKGCEGSEFMTLKVSEIKVCMEADEEVYFLLTNDVYWREECFQTYNELLEMTQEAIIRTRSILCSARSNFSGSIMVYVGGKENPLTGTDVSAWLGK